VIVPDFWAEARRQHRERGRQITVRRFGWSLTSAAEAETMAAERADEALREIIAGAQLERRERKVPYNGAVGVPIREQVVARHGDEVITRNAYGARCLNTPTALFADVDFEPEIGRRPLFGLFMALALISALLGLWRMSWSVGLVALVVSVFFLLPLAKALLRLTQTLRGGPEAVARRRLTAFVAAHPAWNLRLYRTPAGLRLLATHRPFDPHDAEVQAFFGAIGADPVYQRMCANQKCFRARLTAKPWRMGIGSHLPPRPGVWPVRPDRLDERERWIEAYEAKAASFAACRYVESIGSGKVDIRLQEIVALHDRECRAGEATLPLA
jgi:hypothetical protein